MRHFYLREKLQSASIVRRSQVWILCPPVDPGCQWSCCLWHLILHPRFTSCLPDCWCPDNSPLVVLLVILLRLKLRPRLRRREQRLHASPRTLSPTLEWLEVWVPMVRSRAAKHPWKWAPLLGTGATSRFTANVRRTLGGQIYRWPELARSRNKGTQTLTADLWNNRPVDRCNDCTIAFRFTDN